MKVYHAAAEAVLVEQLEVEADVVWERAVPTSDQCRPGEVDFICLIAWGSKYRSIRVLALATFSSVRE